MNSVITAKLDVTKVDKSRLFAGKNGAKYLDIVLIPVQNSKYDDDFMIVQSVSKEERARGVKGAILGNAKIMGGGNGKPAAQKELPVEQEHGDVPF